MNQKTLFLLIPLVLVLLFFIYRNKNVVENFQDCKTFNMQGDELVRFNKCRKLRKLLYDPKGGTILYQDLINPTRKDNPIFPETAEPDTEIPRKTAMDNYKRNCMGDGFSIDNFLMKNDHYNHYGSLRTKKVINNVKVNKPAWSKNPENHRYSMPVDKLERVDNSKPLDNFNYFMGDINVHSPTIVEKDGSWKWFKDGRLQKDKSFNLKKGAQTNDRNVKFRKWEDIHPYDAAKVNNEKLKPARNKYIDNAQSDVPEGNIQNENNSQPQVKKMMEEWGSEYGKNPDIKRTQKGEPYMVTGNSVKDEPKLNRIMPGTKAWDGIPTHILNARSAGCAASKKNKVVAREIEVVPLMKAYESYPKVDKIKAKTPANLIKNLPIENLKDLERYQYLRKMIPGPPRTKEGDFYKNNHKKRYGSVEEITPGKEIVQQYGKPFIGSAQKGYDPIAKKGNKVLASSGFDATQLMNGKGDVIDLPKAHYPIEVTQEKSCPEPIRHRYYYENPGLPQFSAWYIGEVGGSYSMKTPTAIKDDDIKQCIQCSNPGGCRYPNETGGKYSADYFEMQKCRDGSDRICKKCKTCKMGLEVVDTDCGEGGGASDRTCCACSECPDGTYKVYGCDKPNSFFDTECKPFSKCQGFKPADAKKTQELMDKYGKYSNLMSYDSDPGDGNRLYKIRNGLKGGYEDRNKTDPVTNKKVRNPYFGRDVMCGKCDTCPPGWKHIRGCMGTNDDENTVCQRTIDKESYLAKNFTCPNGQFYSKEKISAKIDEMNQELQRKDEIKRQEIMRKNKEIINDPQKLITEKIININDPKNFPDPLPELSDDDLRKIGCTTCSVCPGEIKHRDPNNPGCHADKDTKCKPHTPCYDFQYVSKKGDSFNDQQCSSCRCPQPDYYGIPDCTQVAEDENGIQVPKGCKRKIECKSDEFVVEDPGVYGDTTKPRECGKCKECGYGTFSVKGGCRPGGATDTVCKNWKVCDKKTMIVIEPGTSESDTICKCLDGYELPKDKMGKVKLDANYCVPILGECHKNPCHPKANCFDNFTDDGRYINTICDCDINKGFIQTEDKGFGEDGCFAIPGKHMHEIKTPAASYGELPEKFAKILTHLDADYHRKKTGGHLHKTAPISENEIEELENAN